MREGKISTLTDRLIEVTMYFRNYNLGNRSLLLPRMVPMLREEIDAFESVPLWVRMISRVVARNSHFFEHSKH